MDSNCKRFIIPPDFKLSDVNVGSQRVCIIAIVGKSHFNVNHSKAAIVNRVINTDVFLGGVHNEGRNSTLANQQCYIEGHYDEQERVVYLHLQSALDAASLATMCLLATEEIASKGYQSFWQASENTHARALLFLFSISHIVLLVCPGSSFDISYVRLFRILDSIRQKHQSAVADILHSLALPKDWCSAGRLCSPRILFLFESTSLDVATINSATASSVKTRTQKTPPIKRVQHAMEDQIYRILRKSRVITNISNNSLFAVPANQEFVHISPRRSDTCDPVGAYLSQLRSNCVTAKDSDVPRSRGYQSSRRTQHHSNANNSSSNVSSGSVEGSTTQAAVGTTRLPPTAEDSFREFLWQHIELALNRGFDDNVGRNPVPSVFELPTWEQWALACRQLYLFFMLDTSEASCLGLLDTTLDIDTQFSEGRCTKVLPLAENAYQEGLPKHYTQAMHLSNLVQAKRVFLQHARGPARNKYLKQLEQKCEKVWHNGRELCEEVSLTGKHCVNELHRLVEDTDIDSKRHLPVMSHTSQIKMRATCNCGLKQADRDDPFDHKVANYDFYQKLELICCHNLEHYPLPTFQPSTSDVRAGAPTPQTSVELLEVVPSGVPDESEVLPPGEHEIKLEKRDSGLKLDNTAMSNLSLVFSLGQSGGSDVYGPNLQGSFNPDGSQDSVSMTTSNHDDDGESQDEEDNENENVDDEEDEDNKDSSGDEDTESKQYVKTQEKSEESPVPTVIVNDHLSATVERNGPIRQASTTEYLPGMIHAESPAGLLPKFPSWSLVSLGPYSCYNPSIGVDQPGFMHCSNFLLPWDVAVRGGTNERWPTISEMSHTKQYRTRKPSPHTDPAELTLRLYVGIEYECPRGHRFTLSYPDKIFKAPASGNFKETANKIVYSNMPLYFPCHCRSAKGFMAQLTRLFVVIPEGAIEVKVAPRVQPAPAPCPMFHLGLEGGAILQPGLWVMRFPFSYIGNKGSYLMPTDPQRLAQCHLVKDCITIREIT